MYDLSTRAGSNLIVMFATETRIRVRYGETDQMGVVYYGHYAQYFEVGRTEAIRQLGLTYRELEESGILMPVVSMEVNYHQPARYDDELILRTRILELPRTMITFSTDIYKQDETHLTAGSVTLAFIRKENGKPCRPPEKILDLLRPHFL